MSNLIKNFDFLSEILTSRNVVFVNELADLPSPINNEITLIDFITYIVPTSIDLQGNYIRCGINNAILGFSSENCSITSTGLSGNDLINSNHTTVIRYITFKNVPTAFNFDGTNNTMALDWIGVNVENAKVGSFRNFDNLVFKVCAFLNSTDFSVSGTFDSFVMTDSILTGGSSDLLRFEANTTCNRRIRIQDSPIITFGTANGINVDPSITISDEAYILTTVSFTNTGTGDSLVGLDYTSNKTSFSGCSGITNSAKFANYYSQGNVLATNPVAVGTPIKIEMNSILNPISQKFSHSNNRATYIGGISTFFEVIATLSVTSTSPNDQLGFYISVNGVTVNESELYITTNNNNRAESVSIMTPVFLDTNDYIEIWAENNSSSSGFTVTSCNVIIKSLNVK